MTSPDTEHPGHAVRVAVTDFGGSGPTLVLGPSLGTSARTLWQDVAAVLADRHRVLGWDLPGHGDSPVATGFGVADLAAAVLDAVAGPFDYSGVSLGGSVGLHLLLDAPDRIRSARLLSTGPVIGSPDAWRARNRQVIATGLADVAAQAADRWFAEATRDRPRCRQLVAELATVDPPSYAAACLALAAFDVRARLGEIAAPVLAVAGAEDALTPPSSLRHLADGVRRGRLVVVPAGAHQLPAEAPAAVAEMFDPRQLPAPVPGAARRAAGMQVRREVLGDAHVDSASAGADALTVDFQRFITTYAWGEVWTRPGLDRRSRSMITLTALIARGHHAELAMHLRAALRNGLTVDEIKEVILHSAIYCGVPEANTAFRIAQEVLGEHSDDA